MKSKGRNSIILLRCSNRKAKLELIKNAKKLNGSNVCINEHLTKHSSDLAHKARKNIQMGLITSTWTHNCAVVIKTKAATPDDCKYIKINDENDFYQLVYQCGSNFYYDISNNICLVFLNILTSSLHINLFTLYVLSTCSMQHLYKIMAVNLKCNTGTSDFVSHIKCNTCHKLRHYLCTKVNLLASFMFDVAHC